MDINHLPETLPAARSQMLRGKTQTTTGPTSLGWHTAAWGMAVPTSCVAQPSPHICCWVLLHSPCLLSL